MIQIVAVTAVSSLAEYVERAGEVAVERPTKCENPACGKTNGFWRHTGYKRRAMEGETTTEVRIERFLCKYCGLVVSCLFDFLVPYLVFTANLVSTVVGEYGCEATSYRTLAGNSAQLTETVQRPSHAQIFRWVQRVAARAKVLLSHAQRFALQTGMEMCSDESQVCPNGWKAFNVEKQNNLDELLRLSLQSAKCCGRDSPLVWLHCHLMQNRSFRRAIFSGRSLKLSAQQRVKHAN
jgi:hypothetical protein